MIPTDIRAHFDVEFSVPDKASEIPDGYTPFFVLGGASSLKIEGAIDGEDIAFALTADETEELATGHYWYQVVAELEPESSSSSSAGATSRTFIAQGEIWVIGKITGAGAYDGRSVAKQLVDAIDAVMLNKATLDQQSYVIQSGSGSRSLVRCSVEELMELRKYYAAIVAAENRAANGGSLFKKHKFEFVAP
jgi:hypothetical protein